MIIFVYTFVIVFVAVVAILGVGCLLADTSEKPVQVDEGRMTAAMCTTRLLDLGEGSEYETSDGFIIEQDLVFTYDSLNL